MVTDAISVQYMPEIPVEQNKQYYSQTIASKKFTSSLKRT